MRAALLIGLIATAAALPGGAAALDTCPAMVIAGTADADKLSGSESAETIDALGGDDVVDANGGDDCGSGGEGDDTITGGAGDDLLAGGPGADTVEGQRGADDIDGGDGDDRLAGGFGADRILGGAGADTIDGGQERSSIQGGPGDDRVSSSNGVRDSVDCGAGNDRVLADRGDSLRGCESVRRATSPYPRAKPRRGGRHSTFVIYFRALYAAGPGKGQYVIGAVHSGKCNGITSFGKFNASDIQPGQIIRFRLPPWKSGNGWCRGLWHGVAHFQGGGEDIRLGRFSFRVE
jgi:Ca2+-binding RTX toxin-like protein